MLSYQILALTTHGISSKTYTTAINYLEYNFTILILKYKF